MLYSQGMKQAQIAKELNTTSNTVNNWKFRDKWDERITNGNPTEPELTDLPAKLSANILPESKDIRDQVMVLLAEALTSGQIQPKRWKDIIDTLQLLSKYDSPVRKPKVETDITGLDDGDLDQEIAGLQRLVCDDVDEAEIIVPKRDVTEIEPS